MRNMKSNNVNMCEVLKGELSAFIDGELENSLAEEVKTHIAACDDCKKEYDRLLKVKKLIKSLARVEADSSIPLKIIDRINEREPSSVIAWFPVTIRVALLLAIIFNIAIFNLFKDYRVRTPNVHVDKIIKVENIVYEKEREEITVSFSFPRKDSIKDYISPEVLDYEKPVYTSSLIDKNIEGTVILNVDVNEKGEIASVRLVKPLLPEADSLAIASARSMKFKPAYSGSIAVRTEITTTFNFGL